jgi:hypothetical protein
VLIQPFRAKEARMAASEPSMEICSARWRCAYLTDINVQSPRTSYPKIIAASGGRDQ